MNPDIHFTCDLYETVSTPAYLGPVTSTYTVHDTEWQSLSISAFCCNSYAQRSDCLHILSDYSLQGLEFESSLRQVARLITLGQTYVLS